MFVCILLKCNYIDFNVFNKLEFFFFRFIFVNGILILIWFFDLLIGVCKVVFKRSILRKLFLVLIDWLLVNIILFFLGKYMV